MHMRSFDSVSMIPCQTGLAVIALGLGLVLIASEDFVVVAAVVLRQGFSSWPCLGSCSSTARSRPGSQRPFSRWDLWLPASGAQAAGFTPTEPKAAGFTSAEPRASRFMLAELLEPAGFKLAERRLMVSRPQSRKPLASRLQSRMRLASWLLNAGIC